MSINTVVLTGRLTKDVDLRITNTGKSVASFTLAVDRNYKSDQQADFFNVSVSTLVDVPRGCCLTLSVKNITADTSIDVENANIVIDRTA